MISIYEFTDYRAFLNAWIHSRRESEKGLQGKLAAAAGVSSSLISFILRGDKQLSLEQAAEMAEYIGLNEKEVEYFYLLVEAGRAGTVKLQKQLAKRISEQRKKLANRMAPQVEFSDEVKAIYYSTWVHAAIRNLSATDGVHDVPSIAQRLALPNAVAAKALDFLVANGLCKIIKGRLTYESKRTHIQADSPFVNKHHQNWRLQAMNAMEKKRESDLFFTGPMSLSRTAALEVQRILPRVVSEVMAVTSPSDSEALHCLNIDWFEY